MIKVLGDRVLVLLPPEKPDTVTASGIVLLRDPDAAQLPTQGIVAQLGDRATCARCGAARRFDVAVGDCILFPLGAGEEFTDSGHTYVVLREAEIIGVVPPLTLPHASAQLVAGNTFYGNTRYTPD